MVGEIILTNISIYYRTQQRRRETTGRSQNGTRNGVDKLQIMQFVLNQEREKCTKSRTSHGSEVFFTD